MSTFQIPRNSLVLLLAAQVAVILPHVMRLPVGITVVAIGCIVWRVMIFQGRWNYPGRKTRGAFALAGFVGAPIGYGTILGLDPAVGLLIVAYVLKLLEMHHRRDAFVVVVLGYFVAMCQFLYFQDIPWTVYIFACVLIITAGLIGLNQTMTHTRPVYTLRKAGMLTVQSLPLMLVLFVLFPRIPPIWTVPMQSPGARSGVSDVVAPGDIASIAESGDLAFTATFRGTPPPYISMYWRGLTLSHFDGRAWRQDRLMWPQAYRRGGNEEPYWVDQVERRGAEYTYDVILESTNQNWIFTLTMPSLPVDPEYAMAPDYRWVRMEEIRTKLRYEVTSSLDFIAEPELAPFWKARATLLGGANNNRTRALAAEMRAAAATPTDYVNSVMRMFATGGYSYTLRPGALGDDAIDAFLFDTRRGFCEHFASAFAFMMRAGGIPARVVVGYHGGEYNEIADYVAVYQYDAHAWTEVWLEGRGWMRIDPTTVVAPDRLERGLQAAVEDEESFLENSPFSAFARQNLILAELRLQLSALTYYWDTWVVGYTPETQQDFLKQFLGDYDRKTLGIVMLGAFFGLLGIIGLVLLMKRTHHKLAPLDREYLRFCSLLEKMGIARNSGEGPIDYRDRVLAARPELEEVVVDATDAFVRLNYGNGEAEDEARLKRAVRSLRLRSIG